MLKATRCFRYNGRTEDIDRSIARRIHALYQRARVLNRGAGGPGDFAWTAHHGFLASVGWRKERKQAVREWIESDPSNPKVSSLSGAASRRGSGFHASFL